MLGTGLVEASATLRQAQGERFSTKAGTIGTEGQAEDKFRLKERQQQLGLKPGLTLEQRAALLTQAEAIPAAKGLVVEYRTHSVRG